MAPDSVLLPASFSERSGMSSEWGSEGRDTDGSTGEAGSEWGPRSEAADRESEWLNLALQPEGRIDDSEDAPWRKEAAEAKRRFEDSITQSGASEQTAKVRQEDCCAGTSSVAIPSLTVRHASGLITAR